MLISHETLKHDFTYIFFIQLGFKQKLFTRKREIRSCGGKIFCGKESTLAAANKNWPWPSETKEYLLKQSGGAQNWCGIGEQDLETGWALRKASCDQNHCCVLCFSSFKSPGVGLWGWRWWAAAWLTLHSLADWLLLLGWDDWVGWGQGRIWSSQLPWRCISGFMGWITAQWFFSPKGNLGAVRKKEMDTKMYMWMDTHLPTHSHTHPHTHPHTHTLTRVYI